MVEHRLLGEFRRIEQHELVSLRTSVAVPQALVCGPHRMHRVVNERVRVIPHEFFRMRVLSRSDFVW